MTEIRRKMGNKKIRRVAGVDYDKIEDDISTAELATGKGIEVFLLDRRWNRNGIENSLIKRMGNCEENPNCGWKEIIEEINRRG